MQDDASLLLHKPWVFYEVLSKRMTELQKASPGLFLPPQQPPPSFFPRSSWWLLFMAPVQMWGNVIVFLLNSSIFFFTLLLSGRHFILFNIVNKVFCGGGGFVYMWHLV